MKKKILGLLLTLTLALGLTACNGEKEMLSYDEEIVKEQCLTMYALVSSYDDTALAEMKASNDDELSEFAGAIEYYSGIKTEGTVVMAGAESWLKAQEDLGQSLLVIETEADFNNAELAYEATEDKLIVNVAVPGSSHDAKMEIIYDKNLHITSCNTNVEYSFEELMKKAGVNTAFGMGTVFVMLIVIALIISLFGVFSAIAKSADKKKAPATTGVDNAVKAIEANEAQAEEADDTELVAVIAAAIAAFEGSSSTDGFVVRSIKRIR